jgi:hypothetical protein
MEAMEGGGAKSTFHIPHGHVLPPVVWLAVERHGDDLLFGLDAKMPVSQRDRIAKSRHPWAGLAMLAASHSRRCRKVK